MRPPADGGPGARRGGFTTRASCLLAAGVTAVLCGIALGEVDLVRAGVLAVAVPVIAAVVVRRSRIQIANRRVVEPQQAAAGESVVVTLTITNRSRLPTGAIMLEDQLPARMTGRARFVLESLGGHRAGTVSYRLPDLGRGRYRVGPLRIRLADPFGMIDLVRSFTATTDFVVTPRVERLRTGEPPRADELGDSSGSQSVGTHGADDASTREYRIGDDLRKIHWKSSARTGLLMVRQEERPWRSQASLLLDLRADAHDVRDMHVRPRDEGTDDAGTRDAGEIDSDARPFVTDPRRRSSLEWAVSAAASVGAHAMRGGREVGLLLDPDDRGRLRFGRAEHLAAHLAEVRENGRRTLLPLATDVRTAARESALVAVLGRLSAEDVRVLAEAHPHGGSGGAFAILLDVDTWIGARVPVERSGAHAAARVLRAAGWRVAIATCDRSVEQVWDELMSGVGGPSAAMSVARR